MKKQLLSIVLLSLTITFFGQITITNNDIVSVGTSVYLANDDTFTTGIEPGEPGANKTWDFSSVVTSSVDTLIFLLPSSTPYGNEFPNANFATSAHDTEAGNYFGYMIRNDDKFSTIGNAISSEEYGTIFNNIEPEDIILDFPVDYQNNYDEVYISDIVMESPIPSADSIRTKSTVSKETIIDAWGSLTIPMGTYNTLRQRVNENQIDSSFMKMSGIWVFVDASESNTTYYSWWTNDVSIGFMLFSIDIDNNSAGEITAISFFKGSAVGLDEAKVIASKIYPNPTSGLLYFEFDGLVTGELVIMNQLGQTVASKSINGENNVQFNISHLTTGVYVYHTTNSNGELISSGKVMKK